MIDDLAFGGVYVPAALVLAAIALALAALASIALRTVNLYRFVVYRPIVDLSVFTIILGFLVTVFKNFRPLP